MIGYASGDFHKELWELECQQNSTYGEYDWLRWYLQVKYTNAIADGDGNGDGNSDSLQPVETVPKEIPNHSNIAAKLVQNEIENDSQAYGTASQTIVKFTTKR